MSFYYFSWTLYGGIILLLSSSVVNYFISKWFAAWQRICMKASDAWMNVLTEIVNNIKIIKLNSYIESFNKRLMESRMKEIWAYYKRFMVGFLNYLSSITVPPLLSLTCFALLVAHGFDMSVSDSFAAVNILGQLRGPIRWLPSFIGQLMEFLVSLTRIQNYLLCPEPAEDIVK